MNYFIHNKIIAGMLVAMFLVLFNFSFSLAETYQVRQGINLNARSGPGTNFSIVGNVVRDGSLKEIQRQGDWSEVEDRDGKRYWVNNRYLVLNKTNSWSLTMQVGHNQSIKALSFSPDTRVIATADSMGTVKLWDATSRHFLKSIETNKSDDPISFEKNNNVEMSLSFSSDSRSLFIGNSKDKTIEWDIVTGDILRVFDGANLGFIASNGKYLISGENTGTLKLWDADSGKSKFTFDAIDAEKFTTISTSPIGDKIVAITDTGIISVWKIGDGKLLSKSEPNYSYTKQIAYSSDGNYIFAANHDGHVDKVNVNSGKKSKTMNALSNRILNVAHSHIENQIIMGDDNGLLYFLNVKTNKIVKTIEIHGSPVGRIFVAPSGEQLATSNGASMYLWDVPNDKAIQNFIRLKASKLNSLHTFRNREIFLKTNDILEYYDISIIDKAGHQAQREKSKIEFSKPNNVSAEKQNVIELWDAKSGTLIHELQIGSHNIVSTFFSPDKETLAVSKSNGSVDIWNTDSGKLEHNLKSNVPGPKWVEFSPDKRFIATGTFSWLVLPLNTVEVWEISTGKLIGHFTADNGTAFPYKFSKDGRYLTTADYNRIGLLWETESQKLIANDKDLNSTAFSRDGQWIATRSSSFSGVKLRSTKNGKTVRTFRIGSNDSENLTSVAISPDDKHIIASSFNSILKWDMKTGQLLDVKKFGSLKINDINYSDDGAFIIASTFNKYLTGRYRGSANTTILIDAASNRVVRNIDGFIEPPYPNVNTDIIKVMSNNDTTEFRRLSNGQLLATFASFADGEWIVITPAGFFNSSLGGAKYLALVQGLDAISIDQVYDVLFRPDLVKIAFAGDPEGEVKAAAEKLDLNKIIASGFSPRIQVVSPVLLKLGDDKPESFSQTDEIVEVEIELEDRGGGVGRVEWRVNGTTQGELTDRGFKRIAPNKIVNGNNSDSTNKHPVIRLKQKLFLSAGDNEISVVAYNHANLIASKPVSFTLTFVGSRIANPKLYVLAVGVNDYYDSRLKLNYAVSDVKSISAAFTKAGGELYDEVIVKTVLDSEVTKEGLDAAFNELSGKIRPVDVFVFFVAGHGKTLDGRYYFLPRDFRYAGEDSIRTAGIGQQVWQSWFARLKAQKSVLLYDTCESGTLTGDQTLRGLENVAAIDRLTRATGRTTLTAATDTAPALEGYRGHGLFTYAILDALANSDGDNDRQIEVTELATYIDKFLPQVSEAAFGYRQIPQMSIRGSSFPLVRPVNVLADEAVRDNQKVRISKVPTHVIIKNTGLYDAPGDAGVSGQQLESGLQVRILKLDNGWAQIARDGTKLGYVNDSDLLALK